MYTIKPYSFSQAKKLKVIIQPSQYKKYKIDVFDKKTKEYITSIGSSSYSDFPSYLETRGREYAENRRRLYKIRHEKDRHILNSRGYYADQLLW